ncbi:MAG TPA: response regulator [Spirochaetes bacterium]|nr:response regulator [Spirochaetota bacterium]
MANEEYPSVNERPPDGLKPDGGSFKLMVVDDSMFVTKQLTQILTSEEYDVLAVAENGEVALEKYKSHYPDIDLVTMDITMPKMDGIECLKKIIEFDKNAKIIMISAIGKQDLVKESLLIGAKNYIVKPLNRSKVLERIRNALS